MNVHTMTLAPWELDTLEVIDGDPRTHGALVHSEGPNDGFGPGGFAVGVYEQERCVTAYVLEQNETVHVLRGHVCIALDDGTAVELRTGEIAVLPVGRKSTWTFVEPTRVLFVLSGRWIVKLGVYVARQDGPTVVQTARNCERYGVDSLWHDESLWYRGTISLLAACAATTERLRLGVASVNPYTAHPSHFAMQYATLADLSQGRAVAALGSGVESWISQLGMTWRLPRTSVKEAIEIARGLLNGDTVTYAGQVFTPDEVQMGAPPHFRTPLFWGAMGDRSIETAVPSRTAGSSAMEPAGYVERGMAVLAEGAAAAGRDHRAMEVVQYQVFACDPDAAVAVAQAKDLIALLFRLEFDFCVGQESLMKALSADLDGISTADYARVMQRLADGVPPDTAIPDELVAQTAIAGTPEQCAEQLQRFEALGVTETGLLSATFHVEDTARLVGEQLKPLMDTIPAGHR